MDIVHTLIIIFTVIFPSAILLDIILKIDDYKRSSPSIALRGVVVVAIIVTAIICGFITLIYITDYVYLQTQEAAGTQLLILASVTMVVAAPFLISKPGYHDRGVR
jgi:hypothetical protein